MAASRSVPGLASGGASGLLPGFTPPQGFADGAVNAGPVGLHYWRTGSPGAPPLLVLHGVTDWGLDWARFARRVGDRFDCVLLDQRGHGLSDKPQDGYTAAQMAEDAWQAIRALGLERPAVLGHSMGGTVALALGGAHAADLSRLLLVDPGLRLETSTASGTMAVDVGERRRRLVEQQAKGRDQLLADLRASRPTWDDEDVRNTVESTLLASPQVYTEAARATPEEQMAQLSSLACPTLIVRGEPERGAIVEDDVARRIPGIVPDGLARVTTIAGTGHLPQRDAFELFVAVVLPFLTGETTPPAEGGCPPCFAHLIDQSDDEQSLERTTA